MALRISEYLRFDIGGSIYSVIVDDPECKSVVEPEYFKKYIYIKSNVYYMVFGDPAATCLEECPKFSIGGKLQGVLFDLDYLSSDIVSKVREIVDHNLDLEPEERLELSNYVLFDDIYQKPFETDQRYETRLDNILNKFLYHALPIQDYYTKMKETQKLYSSLDRNLRDNPSFLISKKPNFVFEDIKDYKPKKRLFINLGNIACIASGGRFKDQTFIDSDKFFYRTEHDVYYKIRLNIIRGDNFNINTIKKIYDTILACGSLFNSGQNDVVRHILYQTISPYTEIPEAEINNENFSAIMLDMLEILQMIINIESKIGGNTNE